MNVTNKFCILQILHVVILTIYSSVHDGLASKKHSQTSVVSIIASFSLLFPSNSSPFFSHIPYLRISTGHILWQDQDCNDLFRLSASPHSIFVNSCVLTKRLTRTRRFSTWFFVVCGAVGQTALDRQDRLSLRR